MVLLFGASGYIGRAFSEELAARKVAYVPVSRSGLDYSNFRVVYDFVKKIGPELVINAAGFIGRPNVDQCELKKTKTIEGNLLFPEVLSHICQLLEIPLGQVSSGCIYSGYKTENGAIKGFTEEDVPNFSFDSLPCSFYSGIKALAEERVAVNAYSYLWRIRAPFDEVDCDRNYLSKLQRYAKVVDCINSLSHRGDFVKACLDLWQKRAPYGKYNISNVGYIRNSELVGLMQRKLKIQKTFEYFADEESFYKEAKAPRSSCVLDVGKLHQAGVRIRSVEEAVDESLHNWKPEHVIRAEVCVV